MKKVLLLSVVFVLLPLTLLQAAELGENPRSLRELIALGLKTNLGLQIELVETQKGADQVIVEEALFDSLLIAGSEYGRSQSPYATTFSSADSRDTEQFSARFGLAKQFKTGLQASLTLNSAWQQDNDLTNTLDPSYRSAVILDINQPLLRHLGTDVNTTQLNIAQNRERQAALQFLLRAQQLTYDLESTARQLAASAAIIKLRREALDLANELLAGNRKRFASGVIAVKQVQEAETSVASRQLSLSQAVQQHDLLWQALNRQLNHALSKQFTAAGLITPLTQVPPPDLPAIEQLLKIAEGKRLELKINDFSMLNSALQQNYLDNQLKPQLDLNLQAGLNGLAGHDRFAVTHSPYAGNWPDSFSSMAAADGYQWRVGLDFSIPLGNRAAKSRLHLAKLQLKQDHYRRQDIEVAIRDDLLRQTINVSQSWQQLQIADQFEKLARQSLQQEQRRLEEGLSDTFRIIVYQNTMISARIDKINALTRYQLSLAKIDFASGKIFERHHIVLAENTRELSLEDI